MRLDPASGQLHTGEVGAFITPQAMITIRKDEDTALEPLLARWDDSPELAAHGVAFMVWGLLDVTVDGHFAAVQSLDTAIEGARGPAL